MVIENGSCHCLPAPFAGIDFSGSDFVQSAEYCSVMRSYYVAVASAAGRQGTGAGFHSGNPGMFSYSWTDTIGGRVVELGDRAGGNQEEGGSISVTLGDGLLVNKLDSSGRDANVESTSCIGGRAVGNISDDTDNVEILGGHQSSAVNGGPNLERNRRIRELKKKRKIAKQLKMNGNWRDCKLSTDKFVAVKENKEIVQEARGFFSKCEPSVQDKLRESRARLYIAENNRKAAEEEEKIKRMSSPESLVKDLLRVSRAAGQLMKHTQDQKIEGWAKTVTESIVKSIADSAPSSVPSLESVGYGKSALKSSSGSSDESKSLRLIEYEMMVADCQRQFDEMDVVADDHYNKVFSDLKNQYSDVSMTKEELTERNIVSALSEAMQIKGFGFNVIEEIFENAGLSFEAY